MLNVNRAILVGYAGRDPEVRTLPSGDKAARFTLATTERFRRKDGEAAQATQWHRIAAFGAAAGTVERRVRKGVPLLVEGRIEDRTYEDPAGGERRIVEIVVAGPRGMVNVLAGRKREASGE